MDFNVTVFQKITDFIQNIGIPIGYRQIYEQSFLPGLMIENGTLWIDKNKLKYIGDTLHETGHIALMTPSNVRIYQVHWKVKLMQKPLKWQ
jgi:hypothetical protein